MSGTLSSEQAKELAAKRKNPGRKRKEEEDVIKAALDAACPRKEVLDALALKAKAGEGWAVALYLAYDWGKPVERHEITGADGGAVDWHVIYDRKPDAT